MKNLSYWEHQEDEVIAFLRLYFWLRRMYIQLKHVYLMIISNLKVFYRQKYVSLNTKFTIWKPLAGLVFNIEQQKSLNYSDQ